MSAVRWDRVDALIEVSPGLQDLRAHGLQLLAARRWRMSGAPLPAGLLREELEATWRTHAAPRVLAQIRAACDGPVMLVKGPAVATRYPHPATRPFIDLDVLVPDAHAARAAQAALIGAGFRLSADPAGYPDHLHHLPPLHSPADPIPIEVHSRLKWVDGLRPPTFEALAEEAEQRALGVDGVLTPASGHHALLLAGHLWAHDPLARLLRILDVAVMAVETDTPRVEALAREWGMGRLWRSTTAVADALFAAAENEPWPLRTWARGLRTAREPSVAELHVSRLLSPFAIYPPAAALRAVAVAIEGFARPHDGEPWRRKLARTAQQIARPGMRRSEHLQAIEGDRHPRRIDDRAAGR